MANKPLEDVEGVRQIEAISSIFEVVAATTDMRFAAVAECGRSALAGGKDSAAEYFLSCWET